MFSYFKVKDDAKMGAESHAVSPLLTKVRTAVSALPASIVAVLVVLLTLIIGWTDYSTGWELSLFIFYAAPIIIAVWRLGAGAGFLSAIFCSIVWLVANDAENPYTTQIGFLWAMVTRFFYFGVVVFAVSAIRTKQEADAAHIRMLEEQRLLEMEIVSVSEHGQQRIGQDLHDGICQQLAAIGCAARVLSDDLRAKSAPEALDAALIEDSIQKAVVEARNLARGIFPVHVDRNGLAAALTELAGTMARLTGLSVEAVDCAEVSINSPEISKHLYRIAQEALANAIHHSKANRITLSLKLDGGILDLLVEDNGIGISKEADSRSQGMGMRTMKYRSKAIGATLDISPRPEGGTRVSCRLKPPTQKL